MPTNVNLTATLYTKLVLMDLGDRLKVVKNMSTQYAKEFGNKEQKIGTTFNIRKPQRFIGADLTPTNLAYSPEAVDNRFTSVTVDKVAHVGFEFNSFEKTMSLNEAYDLAKPAAISLANKINGASAKYISLNTFNAVGTPGSAPTSIDTYLSAEDKLVQLGMPENESLTAIVNRRMSSALVTGSKTLFNNSSIVGKQHEEGRVVNQLGYSFEIDQTLYTHTTGAIAGTPLVNGGSQVSAGGNNANGSIVTDGWTISTAGVVKAGDVFTIAGVYSVHPQTRVSTQDLQQFVVLADASSNGSGQATLSIFPAISPASVDAQYQNVDSAPADNAAITVWGGSSSAGKQSTQGLLVHPNAFAFVSVPMEDPSAGEGAAASRMTDPETGISISFIRWFDASARMHKNRFDVAYGFGRLYPELACRIAG